MQNLRPPDLSFAQAKTLSFARGDPRFCTAVERGRVSSLARLLIYGTYIAGDRKEGSLWETASEIDIVTRNDAENNLGEQSDPSDDDSDEDDDNDE